MRGSGCSVCGRPDILDLMNNVMKNIPPGSNEEQLRPAPYWVLLNIVFILWLIGFLLLSTNIQAFGEIYASSPMTALTRQLLWTAAGAAAFLYLSRFDHKKIVAYLPHALLAVVILLVLAVFSGGLGGRFNRTLVAGSVQPSEFAKLLLILINAEWFSRNMDHQDRHGFWLMVSANLILFGLVVLQPDYSMALLYTVYFIFFILFGEKQAPWVGRAFAAAVATGLMLIAALVLFRFGFQGIAFRFDNFDPSRASYHVTRAMSSMAGGGTFGVGLGQGELFRYLPLPFTDSVFAVLVEETGLAGGILVIGLYTALIAIGLTTSFKARDLFSSLVAAGISIYLAGEVILHVSSLLNLMPFIASSLPLISVGGSNLITTLAAMGILANITITVWSSGATPDSLPGGDST